MEILRQHGDTEARFIDAAASLEFVPWKELSSAATSGGEFGVKDFVRLNRHRIFCGNTGGGGGHAVMAGMYVCHDFAGKVAQSSMALQ